MLVAEFFLVVYLAGEWENDCLLSSGYMATTVVSVWRKQKILLLKGTKQQISVYDTMPMVRM
jgi:hypothetical protein